MNQNAFRNFIGGKRGLVGKLAYLFLRLLSGLYRLAISVRNFCYNKGLFTSNRAEVPVISVGNLTAGGTGKTPLVIWICKWLGANKFSCGVLTRGYKAKQGKFTDEPAIIAKSCPDAKIVINPDRTEGAKMVVEDYRVKSLVMDDGFQHRKLRRDLDIVVLDATCPFGYGHMLPAGLLREPIKNLRRADLVVITRSDQIEDQAVNDIIHKVRSIAGDVPVAKAINKYPYAKKFGGKIIDFDGLKERKIFAFCGIGNPCAFVDHLEAVGFSVVGRKVFNDHYEYEKEDLKHIYEEAKYCGADLVLTTLKDWVKASLLMKPREDMDFAYLALELDFIEGQDKVESLLRRTVKEGQSQQMREKDNV
ncbi:Tetraacyldisaccharide 4'-kinase [Anaerohalosphaera lusitana]|uniref:Tetraacyldisaccharide 4'-kinase n=1 Tax=Anaerohalosphaera lusitana TaxID=1936003 RepID=A0A1U9NLX5_9BACT|nr:tetraacyldisaccharide 4'-kinase [Anaerohalosphaera lusitana]AQT68952.1 Tetraacyldisaccharide 4'-kinase [Anaerohalosphaera lusitana]